MVCAKLITADASGKILDEFIFVQPEYSGGPHEDLTFVSLKVEGDTLVTVRKNATYGVCKKTILDLDSLSIISNEKCN